MTLKAPSEASHTPQEDLRPKKRKIPLSPIDMEARKTSSKQLQAAEAWLEARFPKTFNFNDPKPLKIGIQLDLFAMACPFSKGLLRKCLVFYVNSKAYLEATIQENWRYDLNGERVGEVTKDDKEHALQMLEQKRLFRKNNNKTKFFR